MNGEARTQPTLVSVLWPATSARAAAVRAIALAVAGSLLLALSAKIQVPFWPVPMTMQTFVVLMIGLVFGPRLGAATVALYLAEGALGLPIFAGTPEKGIGIPYMLGPTGGYLLGFLAAAWVIGLLARRGWDRRFVSAVGAALIGTAVIFAFGLAWLGQVVGYGKVIEVGLMPFLPGEALKIALAACLVPAGWRAVGRPRA